MKEYVVKETEEVTVFGNIWRKYEPTFELVRCNKCRFGTVVNEGFAVICDLNLRRQLHDPDWFCADAKPREGEDDQQ